jgi:AraC family transcriptional regulator, transcriptional activator of pobA
MNSTNDQLPVYSLHAFSAPERNTQLFQVEIFDARRHFAVKYPHRHDFFEVLYLAKGSGFHVIDSNKYEIVPPCVFFMSPGQAHKLELSNDIEGFIFIFTPEFYLIDRTNQNRLIEFPFFFTIKQTNPPLKLKNLSDIRFIENLFERAIQHVAKPQYSTEILRGILHLILVTCETLYQVDDQLTNKGKGHLMVKRFYQLIEEQYHQNLTVQQYANLLAVTANHLTQTLKQLTGRTSAEIIQSKQILEIKRLLVHTNMNVTEIATAMGFDDPSYFSKFFKRETGKTPLAYRTESMQ